MSGDSGGDLDEHDDELVEDVEELRVFVFCAIGIGFEATIDSISFIFDLTFTLTPSSLLELSCKDLLMDFLPHSDRLFSWLDID